MQSRLYSSFTRKTIVMIDSTPRGENVQRNSFQDNANWAAFGLDPIAAAMSNVNPDAEAQQEAESPAEDIENSFSAWICVLGAFLCLVPTFGKSQCPPTPILFTNNLPCRLHELSRYSPDTSKHEPAPRLQ